MLNVLVFFVFVLETIAQGSRQVFVSDSKAHGLGNCKLVCGLYAAAKCTSIGYLSKGSDVCTAFR